MKRSCKTAGHMPPNRKINELSYKRALSVLNEHFTIPCAPNSQYSSKKLIQSAHSRGISIHTLLVDRGFNGTEVVNKLKGLGQRFLMPAIKHKGVKHAIEDYQQESSFAVSDTKSNDN